MEKPESSLRKPPVQESDPAIVCVEEECTQKESEPLSERSAKETKKSLDDNTSHLRDTLSSEKAVEEPQLYQRNLQ